MYGSEDISGPRDLSRAVAATKAGATQEIAVWREGQTTTLNTTIAQSTDQAAESKKAGDGGAEHAQLGLKVAPLDQNTRESLDIPTTVHGVVVVSVDPNGPAAEQGLQAGDIIERVDNRAIKNPHELATAVSAVQKSGRKSVAMLINRQGTEEFVAVPLKA